MKKISLIADGWTTDEALCAMEIAHLRLLHICDLKGIHLHTEIIKSHPCV